MRRAWVVSTTVMLLAMFTESSQAVNNNFTCGPGVVTVPPGTYRNVLVPKGATCYLGPGVIVENNVIVRPTGALGLWSGNPAAPVSGAFIEGDVIAHHARWFESGYLPGNTIQGNLSLVGTIGTPRNGGGGAPSTDGVVTSANFMCRTIVGGALQLVESQGRFNIGGQVGTPGTPTDNSGCTVSNQFAKSVHVVNNDAEMSVSDNVISGSLDADANNAGIHIYRNRIARILQCAANYPPPDGAGNVAMEKQGQCTAF